MQLGCVRYPNVQLLVRQAKDGVRHLKLTTLKLSLTHIEIFFLPGDYVLIFQSLVMKFSNVFYSFFDFEKP